MVFKFVPSVYSHGVRCTPLSALESPNERAMFVIDGVKCGGHEKDGVLMTRFDA